MVLLRINDGKTLFKNRHLMEYMETFVVLGHLFKLEK